MLSYAKPALRLPLLAKSSYASKFSPNLTLVRLASTKSSVSLKDQSLFKQQALINGIWVAAKDGATFQVTNPATGEDIGSVPEMNLAETKEAIAAASDAFKIWSKTTAKERHDLLNKLYREMVANMDDLALLITLENGKTLTDAKGEGAYAASFIEWFAEEAVRTYGSTIPSPSNSIRNVTIKQPIGVCSILTPWNFPSAMITRKVAPALAAGCTVVIKPPAETPYSALALAELAQRVGIPDGVINVVTTHKNIKEIGKELCENVVVKKVSFTGSTGIAKLLASQCASTLTKMSIEAGGNAPFIVFDDADIEKAVEGAIISKFRASGQTCICANRIYVQSGVYDEFAARLAERVDRFKVGNGLDESTTHGPLIHSAAVDKVERHVEDAVSKGASVLVGGKRLEGNFFAPTVLSDVPTNAQLADEETFGPVAGLIKFETEDEVVKLANNSAYGLAAYVFSSDIGRSWRVSEALEVGMVGSNTGVLTSAYIPFGGVKESGYGREGGREGIAEYLTTKLITFGGL